MFVLFSSARAEGRFSPIIRPLEGLGLPGPPLVIYTGWEPPEADIMLVEGFR